MDCPALTPGKEVTAEDYDGNFWYVFFPSEQARIPAQRFKTALFTLLAYLCVLFGVYWFYWRPKLIAEKGASAVAKEKFQEKVREMEELKSSIFSDKKEVAEKPQKEEKKDRIFVMEDYAGTPTSVLESKIPEFLKSQAELRRKIDAGEIPDPKEKMDEEFADIFRIFKKEDN